MRGACATSHNSIRLLCLIAACGLAWPVSAQGTEAPAEVNPLAGPSVDASTRPTLVKRDFEWTLERIEMRPEAAAVELLTLTPDQREKVDQVLQRRSADVQRVTTEHYELFLKLQGARQGGDRREMMTLMRDFRVVAEPLLKPSLFTQIHDVLPEDQRAEFARLVDEYIAALAAEPDPMGGMGTQRGQRRGVGGDAAPEGMGEASPDPETETRMGDGPKEGARNGQRASATSRRRIEINLLIREMARGFGDMVEERREHTDELFKVIGASEEQQSKIRAIIRENGENAALMPTPEQKAERFQKILKELTPEQRRAWMDWQRGRRAEPKAE